MVFHSLKFDHLFKNLIPNSVDGIKIFGKNKKSAYVIESNKKILNVKNHF